nr:reverse transcriptase domain-containing protein [Tanacetum cinerariifolium]
VYVDDIIFSSSNPQLCREFEALMHEKFQMSSVGELNFFLGLQGHPKLGLWYPKALPFNLVAFSDSDYGGASQDRKSTTGGSQFLGIRLISWQCKKQTIVAMSTTEAEYVAAASCCGQVLWIQNQLLDYGTRVDPNLLNDFDMATNGNGDDVPPVRGGDLQVLDLRTMEELCQPTLNGDDANKHLDKFLHVTQSIKVNGVTYDALHLYLFSHSLTHHATAWNEITNFRQRLDESLFEAWECYELSIDRFPNHNMLPVTQIDTFYNGLTLRHRDTINAATALKAEMVEINKNIMKVLQINQQVKAVTHSCETCGGLHSYNDCPPTIGQTHNVYAAGAYSQGGSRTLPSNTITNPKEDLKGITTRSEIANKVPMIPTTSSPLKVVECETNVTNDTVPPTNNASIKDVQPLVVQIETQIPNSEPVVEPFEALTECAWIDVYEGELTLCVGNKAVTFNLDQTARYSSNYDDMSVNLIDVINVACKEYSQEVLGFSMSGNPTPSTEPIVSISSPTLTPFEDIDFLFEETDAFLATDDEPISPEIDDSYYDSEGYILLLE